MKPSVIRRAADGAFEGLMRCQCRRPGGNPCDRPHFAFCGTVVTILCKGCGCRHAYDFAAVPEYPPGRLEEAHHD